MIRTIRVCSETITDELRRQHGDAGAFDKAMAVCRSEYTAICNRWAPDAGLKFHLELVEEFHEDEY